MTSWLTNRLFKLSMITNEEGTVYDNTESFQLLGVDFVTDKRKGLNFNTYINKCIQNAYANMWMLRRLSQLGISIERLLLTYESRVRVFLEQNVPLWMFSLSQKLCRKIEKVQKIALYIILGNHAHKDYFCNLAILNIETLEDRRHTIARNFSVKILKHPQHRKIFKISDNKRTRSGKLIVEPPTRTARYSRSAVPSLARLINRELQDKI